MYFKIINLLFFTRTIHRMSLNHRNGIKTQRFVHGANNMRLGWLEFGIDGATLRQLWRRLVRGWTRWATACFNSVSISGEHNTQSNWKTIQRMLNRTGSDDLSSRRLLCWCGTIRLLCCKLTCWTRRSTASLYLASEIHTRRVLFALIHLAKLLLHALKSLSWCLRRQ